MRQIHFLWGLLFFATTGFGASVSKVKKAPFNRITINLNRSELKMTKIGQPLTVVFGKNNKEKMSGIVKSIRKREATMSVDVGSDLLNDLKNGTKIHIEQDDKSSRKEPTRIVSKGPTDTKLNPFEIRYKTRGSERERLDKGFSLDLEAGLGVAPILTAGITLGTYISHNSVLEFSFAQGSTNIPKESVDNNRLRIIETSEAQVGVLRFKNFFGNSFYTNAGVGARQLTLTGLPDTSPDDEILGNSALYSQSFADAIFEFSIGNKWQISFFNVGIDWLGMLAPISKIKLPNGGNKLSSAVAGAESENSLVAESAEKLKPDESAGTTFLTKFYIGFAF